MQYYLIISILAFAGFCLYLRSPVRLLFVWMAVSPVANNYLDHPWVTPFFGHRDIIQGVRGNVPGFQLYKLVSLDRVVLLLVLAHALSKARPRADGGGRLPDRDRFRFWYLTFTALVLLSVSSSSNPLNALAVLFDNIILYYVSYLIGFKLLSDENTCHSFQNAIIAQGVVFSIIALVEFAAYHTSRLCGPFYYWEDLGLALALPILTLLGRLCVPGHGLSIFKGGIVLLFMVAMFLLTQTRTPAAGMLFGIVIAMLVGRKLVSAKLWRRFVQVGAISGALLLIGWEVLSSTRIYQDRIGNLGTWQCRMDSYLAAKRMIIANPILGVGMRDFTPRLENYVTQDEAPYIMFGQTTLHNTYLAIAAESGIPALVAFILMLASVGSVVAKYPALTTEAYLRFWGLSVVAMFVVLVTSGMSYDPFFQNGVYFKVLFMAIGTVHAGLCSEAGTEVGCAYVSANSGPS